MKIRRRDIAAITLVAILMMPIAATAQSLELATVDTLVGLWKADREFPPILSGPLQIYHEDGGWVAEISNFTIPCRVEGNKVNFTAPNDLGEFRGRLSSDSTQITGHWVQPEAVSMSVRFTSPVLLERLSPGLWSGRVTPMRDRMTFFFSIKKTDDGVVTGFLRNPQLNFGRLFRINAITMDQGRISFQEENREGTRLPGVYDAEYDLISILIPDAGGTFDFWRVRDSVNEFHPIPATNKPYTYRPPVPRSDGWSVASLADVGMSTAPIEELITRIRSTPMDSVTSPYIHALLISRGGKLVVEEYFHGYDGSEPHDTRSASKSITSTLIGAAEQAALPVSRSTPVYSLFYSGQGLDTLDDRKKRMTVEHLVTMQPGLACYDGDEQSPGNEDVMQNQDEQPDWAQYTLDLPMEHEPGTHAAYCSGSMNLAGAVLSRGTGLWLPELFEHYLARPLQMRAYHMNLTPVGQGYGGGGLRLTARDFLKLGYLYLNKGRWNGSQVLSSEWIHDALQPQTHMWQEDYGYGWWLIDYAYKDRQVKAFYAGGNGGQYVIGVPELDLLVTFFAGNYNQRIMHQTKRELVPEYILRAIE